MNKDEILNDIKQRYTKKPNNQVLDRIMSGIGEYEMESQKQADSYKKVRILRPAIVLYIIALLLASTFAVTAAVNEDVRGYLISIFGGSPNPVEGELIGATAESDGVEMTVDAVVAEGNSLFMIFTLRDKNNILFDDSTMINGFKASVGGDPNYSAVYNAVINNGEKNYILLNNENIKRGIHQVQFIIEGLKTPDPTKVFSLPIGTTDYKPEGIDGYTIDYVMFNNNRIEASISISDQSEYVHNFDIRAKNIRTGEIIHQKGETTEGDSAGNTKKIRWYSEKLDSQASDYQFIISFDKIYTFSKPLQTEFPVDFSRKPVKTIYPKDIHVLTATVEKVTVHQMSIIADLKDTGNPVSSTGEVSTVDDEKPIPVSEATDFLDEPLTPSIHSQRMSVRYEDGTEAATISASSSSRGENNYRYYLMLNGSLDYSKKPVLHLGDAQIPLY